MQRTCSWLAWAPVIKWLASLSGWLPDPRTEAVCQPLDLSSAWSSACVFCNMAVLNFLTVIAWSWLLNLPLMKIAEVTVMKCLWHNITKRYLISKKFDVSNVTKVVLKTMLNRLCGYKMPGCVR